MFISMACCFQLRRAETKTAYPDSAAILAIMSIVRHIIIACASIGRGRKRICMESGGYEDSFASLCIIDAGHIGSCNYQLCVPHAAEKKDK